MNVIDELTQRNTRFATSAFQDDLQIMPSIKTLIIGCIDPRVDPANIFGLKAGEAAVIRNIGGRINPATLQSMAIVRTIAAVKGKEVGLGWNLIVLHHTDCGITPCLLHAPALLASNLGVEPAELEKLAIADPYAAVAIDVAALKANPQLPAGLLVTGMVYDVATGTVEVVVPPALLRVQTAISARPHRR